MYRLLAIVDGRGARWLSRPPLLRVDHQN